jgi:hypothetical protein
MESTFSITKVTGAPPWTVTSGGHAQPSANGSFVVVTTGSSGQQRPGRHPHLRLVRD